MGEELRSLRPDGLMRPPDNNRGDGLPRPDGSDVPVFAGAVDFGSESASLAGAYIQVGPDYFEVLGKRFRRQTPAKVLGRATFLTQLDSERGKPIDLYEGEGTFGEDRVPKEEETFAKVTKRTAEYIEQVSAVYDRGGHVLLTGPTGCGKTTLAKTVLHLANRNGLEVTFSGDTKTKDFMYYDVLTDVTDWRTGQKKKSVIRVPGPLLDSMVNGDGLIVNEGNMMPADLQSLFFQVMDTGEILFSDLEQLKVFYRDRLPKHIPDIPVLKARKGFQLIVSLNPDYIGTEAVNKAWERRFKRHGGLIEMGYLSPEEEIEAVEAELKERNSKFGHEVITSPDMVRCFVSAAHTLRNGIVTYQEGDPPQTKQKIDESLKHRFQELISTRTIIYWIENYLMNNIDAKEAADRTFLAGFDRHDRRDSELRKRAIDTIDSQIDQMIGGGLSFLEGLAKPQFNQAITVAWEGRKAVGLGEVAVDGESIGKGVQPKDLPVKSREALLDEAEQLMKRYVHFSALAFTRHAAEAGQMDAFQANETKQLLGRLMENGLTGEQAEMDKKKLRETLHLTNEVYDQFLRRVEVLYQRVLRRQGLLGDILPIKDVGVPATEHILPVITPSSLTNLQVIDNAIARGKIVKMRGPTGAAKSTLGRTWAYLRGRRLVEYPFSGETKQSDFGYKTTLIGGETKHVIQFLYKAAQRGYVVMINEFNMAWPEVVTAFNNIADKGRKIKGIKIHPDFALIYTENPPDLRHARSPQYAGAKPQNQAVENRCGVNMWVDYPPEEEEAAILARINPNLSDGFARSLVAFVRDIRTALDAPSISDTTKDALRRFSLSTDELMELVRRCGSDREVAVELATSFNGFSDQQKSLIAPHLARLMPLLGEHT